MVAKQKVLISAMRHEAKGILSVEMVSAQADDLIPFSAGGHIDVFLRDGLVRQYSLMNDPKDSNRYQFAVLLENEGRTTCIVNGGVQPRTRLTKMSSKPPKSEMEAA